MFETFLNDGNPEICINFYIAKGILEWYISFALLKQNMEEVLAGLQRVL